MFIGYRFACLIHLYNYYFDMFDLIFLRTLVYESQMTLPSSQLFYIRTLARCLSVTELPHYGEYLQVDD